MVDQNIIKSIRKINTELFTVVNKFYRTNIDESAFIKRKLILVDEMLSTNTSLLHLEMIYLNHWSILNTFIKTNIQIRNISNGSYNKLPAEVSLFNYQLWNSKGTTITKQKYNIKSNNCESYIIQNGEKNNYNIFVRFYDGFRKIRASNYRSVEPKDLTRSDFFLQVYLSLFNEEDIKIIESKLNKVRNNLTLTHGYKIVINELDCLLLIMFLDYLFKIPNNIRKYHLPGNSTNIKLDQKFKIKGEIIEIIPTTDFIPKQLLVKYKKDQDGNTIYSHVCVQLDREYPNIKVGSFVEFSFFINTNLNQYNYELLEKKELMIFNNITSYDINLLPLTNVINKNSLRVSGKVINKHTRINDNKEFYYIVVNYYSGSSLKSICINIVENEEYYYLCKVGDYIEVSFIIYAESTSNKNFINNPKAISFDIVKFDNTIQRIINSFMAIN